ncbi:hypothetical protein [Desertivibrio insolitus]|uniref:hypothetical protein n=1 Tax=Herbiconiux sp. SYSU D00978 TaxID=2812562 RepID=UPI001A9752E4|nr:hypothetical protein [Herbiconiux sp. SYSU D00978]
MSAIVERRPSLGRLRAARVVAGLLCLVAAVPYFGLIDLATLVGWVNPAFVWPVPLEVSWGVLFTFFLAAGYGWVAVVPTRPTPGVAALAIGGGCLVLGAALGADGRPLPVAVAVLATTVLLAVLTDARTGVGAWRVHWPYLVLVAPGVALWLPYVLSALAASRLRFGSDITNGVDHWPVQASAGLAVLAGSIALAVWHPGRPLLRVAVVMSAGLIGVAALAYPDRDGATEGQLWAIAVVLWALVLALLPVTAPGGGRRSGSDRTGSDGE